MPDASFDQPCAWCRAWWDELLMTGLWSADVNEGRERPHEDRKV